MLKNFFRVSVLALLVLSFVFTPLGAKPVMAESSVTVRMASWSSEWDGNPDHGSWDWSSANSEEQSITNTTVGSFRQSLETRFGYPVSILAYVATDGVCFGSNEVMQAMENIAAVSEENGAAVEQVSASTEEMTAQVEEVNASAQSLSDMAALLQESTQKFTL